MFKRGLTPILSGSKKSVLLLGPRQTGKSTLIEGLNPEVTINLAHEPTFLTYSRNPSALDEIFEYKRPKSVFLDEIQRIPSLLNTVQVIMDKLKGQTQFFLTGSSARKLKRGNANLLPGRVHVYCLGPLCFSEIGPRMELRRALSTGTLPAIYSDESKDDRRKTLLSYGATYLREEIQAEALTRNLEGFSRFLSVCATTSTQYMDLSRLSSEAQVPRESARRYFEILEDTLVVNRCPAFSKSNRRRLIQHPRFFFFDTGVLNALLENFEVSQDRIGVLFENFLYTQMIHSAMAKDVQIRISSYRTEHGAEIDFIVEREGTTWAIEAKSGPRVRDLNRRGFKSFQDYYGKPHHRIVAYTGNIARVADKIGILPWQKVLAELGLV